jgi:Flp pilus assembly CpaE family ATPase
MHSTTIDNKGVLVDKTSLSPISFPAHSANNTQIHVVTGAVGGSGASTLASALAQVMDAKTLLADLQFSGGIDTTLGIEKIAGLRWADVFKHPVKPKILQEKCPKWGEISVLSNSVNNTDYDFNTAIETVLASTAEFDAIVLDVPRILLNNRQLLANMNSLTIIVPKTIGGLTNTLSILKLLKNLEIKINLVLTSHYLPKRSKLLTKSNIEKLLNREILGTLPFESRIALNIDLGNGPQLTKSSKMRKLAEKLRL